MTVFGQITYTPPTTPTNPIPSLSESMLLGMAISLAFVAFKITKRGSHLHSLAAAGLALSVSWAGMSLVGDVNANGVIAYLSEPNGGTKNIEYANNEVHIINSSGKKQKIQAITPIAPSTGVGSTAPMYQCQIGDELAPDEGCYVMFVAPSG